MDVEYQRFRIPPDGPLIRIEVIDDEESGQKVVFLDDIELQFPGIRCVMHGDIAVTYVRDSKQRRIEPLRIKYHPGTVLDVILSSNSAVFQHLPNNSISAQPNSDNTGDINYYYNNTGLGPIIQHPDNIPANSLLIPSSYNGSNRDSNYNINNTLSRSLNNLTINTCVSSDDSWQRQYDISLPQTPSSAAWSPSNVSPNGVYRSASSASRTASSVSRTPSTSRAPNITTVSTPDSPANISADSTLQTSAQLFGTFETSIKIGQLDQTEAIKGEIWAAFNNVQTEVTKNQELQMQVLEMQQSAAEMQHQMMQIQKQTLDRVALLHSRVQAILTQTYELHEYPIPRLFIVLPRETQRRDLIMNPFTNRFRLHFLCECGDHTRQQPQTLTLPPPSQLQHQQQYPYQRPAYSNSNAFQDHQSMSSWGSGSTTSIDSSASSHDGSITRMLPHHIHLAKHEGYELDRPNEFFQKYGTRILTLLQMLKYGVTIAGIVVPALAPLKLKEGIDKIHRGLAFAENNLEPKVDYAIQYLEDLASNFANGASVDTMPDNQRSNQDRIMNSPREPVNELEALEGADLRHLSSFLKIKDEGKVLGNLYRIVTNEGHVKWVCLDHYRENYRDSSIKQFRDAVAVNNGTFEETTGKVSVRLSSSTIAKQFYESLERARFIQELSLVLDWETTLDDLRSLQDTIRKANVAILKLDFCNTQSPSWELFGRNRRYDPILQMMADAKLQALYLMRCDGFWSRLSKMVATATTSFPSSILLRVLSVQGAIESWKAEQQRMEEFLKHCSHLTDLRLQCGDVDTTFKLVKNATSGFQYLRNLELSVSEANRQEQVTVEIAQPQAEILSMSITTNKRPYTQLIYSGHVRKLILYNAFSLSAERATLEKFIQQNQHIHELAIRCSVHEFVPVFEFIRARAAYSKNLCLVKVQDLDGCNKISSKDLKNPESTLLELLSPEPAGREEILRAFGWALKKVLPGMQFTPGLLKGFEEATSTKGSILQSLHINVSALNEESLDLLAKVIQYSQPTLTNLDITIYASQTNHRELSITALARFVVRISSQITRLQMHMYGLSLFLFGLASAASAVQAASTQLSRTITISGRGSVGAATFPVVSRPTLLNVVTMPNLRELDIKPEADTYGKMLHCQINPPHTHWLQIPLFSPSLKTIKFGYLDFLKDDWIVVLQSIRYEIVETLIFQGTNFSDGQVRQLLECLTSAVRDQVDRGGDGANAIALKQLRIEGSLVTSHVLSGLVAQLRLTIPSCEVHV
ncbi:hypothetical protein BGZ80_003411 [Entomortierella chlamydospora]|uniref:Uncharacterized protein n=1 Tax=Entomortierella chlamydospora TaxID=101097 RepID=A0A9P6N4G7_9FUNG|nr:hypothetical protein BGZ80_003411 [Entomortierella chlamydospora]